jgi:ribonuclease Z
MFDIVFLGTSASAPSIHRGLPAQVVLAGEYRFLIDCGEGTQRQILKSGIGFKKLNHILLTHAHLDHILGLGGLISTFVQWENMEQLEIWGGKPALNRVQTLLFDVVLRDQKLPLPIHLIDLKPEIIINAKQFAIEAFPVSHRGSGNFGFIFREHSRHPFLVEKAEALGVAPGPERGKLVNGEAVMLADGTTITPDMVLGDLIIGTKLVYIGDVGRVDNIRDYVADADTLVIESTFLDVEAEIAAQFGHITATQAATLALETGVKTLILTHISRRYRERDVIKEARAIFPDTFVARDLVQYSVRRGGATKVESE